MKFFVSNNCIDPSETHSSDGGRWRGLRLRLLGTQFAEGRRENIVSIIDLSTM